MLKNLNKKFNFIFQKNKKIRIEKINIYQISVVIGKYENTLSTENY